MNDAGMQDQPIPVPETIEVDNLDQFVQILTTWHAEKCAAVQHLLTVPEGTSFIVGEGVEENEIILSGDILTGFKFGLELAMMQMGTLPFIAELEDVPVVP